MRGSAHMNGIQAERTSMALLYQWKASSLFPRRPDAEGESGKAGYYTRTRGKAGWRRYCAGCSDRMDSSRS